jgi:hypothetical protein
MDPITITVTILTLLAKYGPDVAKAAQAMVTKTDPTQADWDQFWVLTQVPFEQLVPKKG